MFANITAIETLIRTDTKATDEEKTAVLSLLAGKSASHEDRLQLKVVGFAEAARMIGKDRKSIYHLLRNGTLKGFYSGKNRKRATGITVQSIEDALSVSRNAETSVEHNHPTRSVVPHHHRTPRRKYLSPCY